MFEKVIADLLNKVLGDFIEGIEAEQLKISIFSGDVELFNLSIKPDILDNMPLPFNLKYGKVGRIFVDVPVTGLLSKPIKLEVSEIFILVETKEYKDFDKEVVKEAFIKSVQSQLDKLEDYFESQLEASQSESGVVMGVVNRLIDNIQIDIQNIYIRFEDMISNEKMPYAISISCKAVQLYTCNEKFERKFINGNNMAYKAAKLVDLQVYLDYSLKKGSKMKKITFQQMATVKSLDKIEDDDQDIYDLIVERNEKGRDPSKEIIQWKHFMMKEIKGTWKNLYLIKDFNIEIRLIYNKNPDKKNKKPRIQAALVFGSKFADNAQDPMKDYENISS